ncbi:MAG: hypothetical protein C0444_06690 [Microbacterium sp.]|nr:hypothetical protein [Microbacterium sp.]MBA4345495.1 hypothetical protein [Microbacterium sp.]
MRLVFLAVSGAVVLWSLVSQAQGAFQSVGGFAVVFVPLAVWALLGGEYVSFVVRTRTKAIRLSTDLGQVAEMQAPRENELNTLVAASGKDGLNDIVVWTFVRALLEPKGFYERISERVELGHVSLVRRVSYTCDLLAFRSVVRAGHPSVNAMERIDIGKSETSLVVPLQLVRRGSLGGGLRVLDDNGKTASTVSSYDLSIFLISVFRSLVKRIALSSLPLYIKDIEPAVSKALRARTVMDVGAREELLDRFQSLLSGAPGHRVPIELMELLIDWHPICVTVPPSRVAKMKWPDSIRFTIERRDNSELRDQTVESDDGDSVLRALDGLRLLLGVPINRIYVSVADADRARSYHLEVCGPAGTYVARQAFSVMPPEAASEINLEAFVSPRQGQRRARALVTGLERSEGAARAKVFFAVKFFERSPGSFGVTTIASLLLSLAAWLLFVASSNGQAVQQTVAGVLLALPAAAVALSGLDSRREYRQPSLLSMGLNGAMLFAVSASLFVVLVPLDQALRTDLWRVVVVFASFTLVVSTATWIIRAATERILRNGVDSPVENEAL